MNPKSDQPDERFADCKNGDHAECLYQWPNPANPATVLTCTCLCHAPAVVTDTYPFMSGDLLTEVEVPRTPTGKSDQPTCVKCGDSSPNGRSCALRSNVLCDCECEFPNPKSTPPCTCFATPDEQHATYCPREGMDYDPAPSGRDAPLRAISNYCGEYLEPERVAVMPKAEDIAGHCKSIADRALAADAPSGRDVQTILQAIRERRANEYQSGDQGKWMSLQVLEDLDLLLSLVQELQIKVKEDKNSIGYVWGF